MFKGDVTSAVFYFANIHVPFFPWRNQNMSPTFTQVQTAKLRVTQLGSYNNIVVLRSANKKTGDFGGGWVRSSPKKGHLVNLVGVYGFFTQQKTNMKVATNKNMVILKRFETL